MKDDLSIAEPAYKDSYLVHHLEEDARDAIAMAREDNLTLAMTALIYFSQLSKPLPGKQRRANLASLIDIFETTIGTQVKHRRLANREVDKDAKRRA